MIGQSRFPLFKIVLEHDSTDTRRLVERARPCVEGIAMAGTNGASQTHFGFSTVRLDEKQRLVDDVFRQVARRYDLMNDLMSFGVHRAWKNEFVAMLPPRSVSSVIDVAGGTGDIAFRIVDAGGPRVRVTLCDISAEMLAVGRERAGRRKGGAARLRARPMPRICPSRRLPSTPTRSPSASATCPRSTRPWPRPFACSSSAGASSASNSHPSTCRGSTRSTTLIRRAVIPTLGKLVAGDEAAYRYLVESIRRFPRPALFSRMIERAGFRRVTHRPLSGNIAAIHSAWKL